VISLYLNLSAVTCPLVPRSGGRACVNLWLNSYKSFNRLLSKKLVILDAATELNTLRVPPGNRLEALKGKRKGQHSICINDKWQICFQWKAGNVYDVEIADYH